MKVQSINPVNGKVIKEFDSASKEDVLDAVSRAKAAQKVWAGLKKEERISAVQKLKEVLSQNKDEILKLILRETSYTPEDGEDIFSDVFAGFDYYCDRYNKIENINFPIPEELKDTEAEVQFIPHGVVGHIGIWNYPFWQTMITVIPALLTGNAIVFKPSEYVTMTCLKIAECIQQVMPKDVFITVIGGADVGKFIVSSDVDVIVFTGGIDTGEDIIKNAGIKPLILELSGNDAGIVCSDCDLEQTVKGVATGTFGHSGQVCTRIKRVYVVKDIADEFISKLVEFAKTIKVHPLIRENARKNVHRVVVDAVKNGAELLLGGEIPEGEGFFYPATLLKMKDDNLEVMREETFGPVCSIVVVENENEAIKRANNSKYGLGGSVWTQDYDKGKSIAEKLETGTVWINDSNAPLVCGEFTQGMKSSSIASSQERLMMFLKKRNVISFNSKEPRDWWF